MKTYDTLLFAKCAKKMEKYNLKLSDIYFSKFFLIYIAIFKIFWKESD